MLLSASSGDTRPLTASQLASRRIELLTTTTGRQTPKDRVLAAILGACVYSLLGVLILTAEFLNFLLDSILHEMLLLISLSGL